MNLGFFLRFFVNRAAGIYRAISGLF